MVVMMLVRLVSCASVLSVVLLAGCPSDRVCDTGATQVCVCPSLAMGAQTCTTEGVWGTCTCGEPMPDGGVGDAPVESDAPVENDASPGCMVLDEATLTMSSVHAETDALFAQRSSGTVLVSAEAYFGTGAVEGSATVELTDENYATCTHCVVLRTDCVPSGSCGTSYLATQGTLEFAALTTISMDAVLTNARLIEVTFDTKTFESTPVPSGRSYCIERVTFSGTTCGDGECGTSETPENCPGDCS
jgi:hypothetical protein